MKCYAPTFGWRNFCFSFAYLSIFLLISCHSNLDESSEFAEEEEEERLPNSWFYMQRAFPLGTIPKDAYQAALKQSAAFRQNAAQSKQDEPWEFVGPVNVGGRITDLEMYEDDLMTIYAGTASGGIFKSSDQGVSWVPIFDEAASLSIGDLDLAPTNKNIIYVGTGEANAGGGSLAYDGYGVYKSTDAGLTWQHKGLENVGSIGKVEIDPKNENRVFVAAMGDLFGNNPERGIYRTIDGGDTWEQVLFLNDSVGGIDLVIHPNNPDTIYAATWQRVRRPNRRSYGGPGSGIFRSYDGGDNWERLTNGLPGNQLGRIGLCISPSDPEILYTIISDRNSQHQGFWKTSDGGNTWTFQGNEGFAGANFSYWFGKIFINPFDPSQVFATSLDMHASYDDGNNWESITVGKTHVDQHAMIIHPMNPDLFIIGNDGGVYVSQNAGLTWEHSDNMPITQFYTCEMDYQNPRHFLGGTQDNGTVRTRNGQNNNWNRIYGGDGFVVKVDPIENNIIYAESQYGALGRSEDGGSRFTSARTGIDPGERKNWKTPYILDPMNPSTLYYGAQTIYKSTDKAVSWRPISPDLTNGPGTNLTFGTVSTITVSPVNNQIIYAGTDDGNVWVSIDGGGNWEKVSGGLPQRWVTAVEADPFDEATAYLTFSGYRNNSYLPHVYRTRDYGQTWENIGQSIPEAPANDIVPDPANVDRLFLATDFGVYETADGGVSWDLLSDGIPNVPILDLVFHQPTRTLVAATYGRSMYKLKVEELVSIKEQPSNIASFSVSPNPVNHNSSAFFILEKGGRYDLLIHDANGKLISRKGLDLPAGSHSIGIQHMVPDTKGMYVVILKGTKGSKTFQLIRS
ncbi:MAG: T9SS type A sorting domain-containing protein [Saprospiraceae bacterium]